jgi:ABC-type sugar transport system ATPase subunit
MLRPGATEINFQLRAGEIVGIAGLEGHGQDAFLNALRGAGAVAGKVVANGQEVHSPQQAFANGVAYVPRDRRAESLFPSLAISENFALPTLSQDVQRGVISWRHVVSRLRGYVEQLAIRIGHPSQPIPVLSGGNQQKVIIARWLAANPRVLLLNDPTRGIDLGAKRDLYGVLERLAAGGVAVVMLSTEIDEHLALMDRVVVFRDGSPVAEISREQLTRNGLVSAFFGSTMDEVHES